MMISRIRSECFRVEYVYCRQEHPKLKEKRVEYAQSGTPPYYTCQKCGRQDVKLWRPYNGFDPDSRLRCALCVGQQENIDVSRMRPDGTVRIDGRWEDLLGGYTPAVPLEDDKEEVVYWGRMSIPRQGLDWWQQLPNW